MSAIWNKFAVLASVFGRREDAAAPSRRWRAAAARDRELPADLIRIGGVLTMQPVTDGDVAGLDPLRLAYEAGRRDLALQLLSMMELTISELNQLMEDNDVS